MGFREFLFSATGCIEAISSSLASSSTRKHSVGTISKSLMRGCFQPLTDLLFVAIVTVLANGRGSSPPSILRRLSLLV